jgi:hypothetical protein
VKKKYGEKKTYNQSSKDKRESPLGNTHDNKIIVSIVVNA